MKKKILLILLIISIFALSACGHIKNDKEIVKWVNSNYEIEAEVISKNEIIKDNEKVGIEYVMRSKNTDVEFKCVSRMSPASIDGAVIGNFESTTSDYYEKLLLQKDDEIKRIESRYGIEFLKTEYDGSIYGVWKKDFQENDLEEIGEAVSQLKNIIKPTLNYGHNIFVILDKENDEWSDWYYFFGDMTLVDGPKEGPRNSHKEFYEYQGVPMQIEEDAIRIAQQRHPTYKSIHTSFHFPKTLMKIDCGEEQGYISESYFIAAEEYNNAYKQYNGKIPDEVLEELVKSSSEIDMNKYEDQYYNN